MQDIASDFDYEYDRQCELSMDAREERFERHKVECRDYYTDEDLSDYEMDCMEYRSIVGG